MKRIAFLFALVSFGVGCFGACGGGSDDSASSSSSPSASSSSSAATSGSDTTTATSDPPPSPALVMSTDACTTDADCVPGGCCHPATCVGRANAPVCGESVCTTECRYGTLDCGGSCLCHEGHCAAQLSQPPHIPGVPEVQ